MYLLTQLVVGLCLAAVILMSGCTLGSPQPTAQASQNIRPAEPQPDPVNPFQTLFGQLVSSKLETFGKWEVDDDDLYYYAIPTRPDGTSIIDGEGRLQFLIADKDDKILFREEMEDIERVYEVWALRTGQGQLVIEYGEGGQDSFVKILDFQQGKVVDLTQKMEEEGKNQFSVLAEVIPATWAAGRRAREPFELYLTSTGSGLDGPDEATTYIYKYQHGQYGYDRKIEHKR